MDFENIFLSPPQFFGQFFRLALSLLKSTLATAHRRSVLGRCSLVDFDIDPQTGFFPRRPLPRLTGKHELWELKLAQASGNLSLGTDETPEALEKRPFGERWRKEISDWPVLDVCPLCANSDYLRRAHYVLAWLVQFYVHSQPPTNDELPKKVPMALAVPLVQISRRLGIAPVLTFADTVLWNWEPVDPSHSLSLQSIDSMHVVNLFSGTEDEKYFYIASAKAELRGVEMLRIFEDFRNLPNVDDLTTSKLSRDLSRLAIIIDDISQIILDVKENCKPDRFYQFVRPWFVGSDAGSTGPSWVYEGVPESDKLDLSGPSAGQSAIMHALDIFLDIDHKLRQRRSPAPSAMNKRADHGFMERMRRYMPGKHREYLSRLGSMPRTIRDVAQNIPALRDPYDKAVDALKNLRDLHLRVACLYIISGKGKCPMMARLKQETGFSRGTGGTEVSSLLKTGRDNTKRAMFQCN